MRVLVVEDEKGIAGFLRDGLQEEGFAVDVAYDGAAGAELALTNDYDVILLDWMLPKLSGIEVCRQVRKEQPSVPIIFLTAKDTVQDTVFGLDIGASDYLRKPIQFDELMARIRVQLRGKAGGGTVLRVADVVLNPATHQVFRGTAEIMLTPKEFALLEFLMYNKGTVCTRTRIMEHVWDINFSSDTSVIDVFVNYLRKKLGKPGGDSLIQTVRGVGYVIRGEQ